MVRGLELRIRGSWFRVWGFAFGFRGFRCSEFSRFAVSRFGVWSFVFEVRGFAFGVSRSVLGVFVVQGF